MSLLDREAKDQVKRIFQSATGKSIIKLFTQAENAKCRYCRDVENMYSELTEGTDKIELRIKNLLPNMSEANEYGIMELAPCAVILDKEKNDTGIRFYGVPAGYEFTSLVETLLMVATGKHTLKESTVNFAKNIDRNIDIKVFVSLSCPYCPQSVHLANQLAYVSGGKIKSSMIETAEFPFLSNKYSVMGVPKTVINESISIEGAAPEDMLVEKIRAGLG